MANEQKVKAISYTWWIGMIIGAIVGLAYSDSRYIDSQPVMEAFKGGFFGALLGALLGYLIDQISNSTGSVNISEKFENKSLEQNLMNETQASLRNYQDSVHHFQFLSDETLISKYENIESRNLTKMEKLAIEEELVRRKLIKFSKSHEKIEKIKEIFENDSTQDEILKAKEFIASRLGCDVEGVKRVYMDKLKEMKYESSDLNESELAFGKRAKEEAQLLGMRVENTPSSLILEWSREFINTKNGV